MQSFPEKPSQKVPVLLLAFNRPTLTDKVLASISGYAPPDLYVSVDGPRAGRPDDERNGAAIRESVAVWEKANPATRVHRLYREANLGCGRGVSSAISWFFSEQEMGIILEDDCLPNRSFYSFCQEMLYRYANDERIMHIGGSNYLEGRIGMESTYYFSKYPQIWGWASWRRAWSKYAFDMPDLDRVLVLPEFRRYYDGELFIRTRNGAVDTWDIQWIYTFLLNGGLSVLPKDNLIRNTGFAEEGGIHLTEKPKWYNDATVEFTVLIHPTEVVHHAAADDYVFRKAYRMSLAYRVRSRLKRLFFKKS